MLEFDSFESPQPGVQVGKYAPGLVIQLCVPETFSDEEVLAAAKKVEEVEWQIRDEAFYRKVERGYEIVLGSEAGSEGEMHERVPCGGGEVCLDSAGKVHVMLDTPKFREFVYKMTSLAEAGLYEG